jgi:hypothetical protein
VKAAFLLKHHGLNAIFTSTTFPLAFASKGVLNVPPDGQNLAILYSFAASCKANEIPLRQWLEEFCLACPLLLQI